MKFIRIDFALIVLFWCLCAAAIAGAIAGCTATEQAQAAKVAQGVANATTQPAVEAGATVATAATGYPITGILSGVGIIAGLLATWFMKQSSAANAKLDVAAAAAGVTDHATAIANLVTNNSPSIAKAAGVADTVATDVATIAPIVGQLVPKVAAVANEVGQAAAGVAQALTPAPTVTIAKMGS